MSANISSLESLALNILKNSSVEKIAKGVNVSELDPCSLCNRELFLYEIKNPITILICGHIYHRDCIENSIKKHSICPRPDCKKEIKTMVESTPGSLYTADPMNISPDFTIFQDTFQKKRVSESAIITENFEKVIEVNENTNNFLYHYSKITQTESKSEIAKSETWEQACLALVNDEIRKQLPDNITNDALKKRKERAGKIYNLFVGI
ncbi:12333_t:CDS:2, partial [Ambispora gerdemannii]